MRNSSYTFPWLSIMFLLIAGIIAGLTKCNEMHVSDVCFRHGYSDVRASIVNGNYCVKRVDQTDVVVPLKQVEASK